MAIVGGLPTEADVAAIVFRQRRRGRSWKCGRHWQKTATAKSGRVRRHWRGRIAYVVSQLRPATAWARSGVDGLGGGGVGGLPFCKLGL